MSSPGSETERKSASDLILIGLGANLPGNFDTPRQALEAALLRLESAGLRVIARSRIWRSRPVPVSDQPWFANAVAAIETELAPAALLALLHRLEDEFGRVRTVRNAPRVLDLDLLAYGRLVQGGLEPPLLPHPRLAERAFVLLPLADIAADWVHPVSGAPLCNLIACLPADQEAIAED